MDARVQGAISVRGIDGTIKNFAGDATKLYDWDGVTWNDVTRTSGGAYATGTDGGWEFEQFGDLVVAVNGIDAPQKFAISTSSNFEALGGSPPVARFVKAVRDFLVLGRISTATNRVQWSGINNAETWTTSAATQADLQDLPDGGQVMGLVGGEYGVIFQERAIRRMTYVGSPIIFQIDKISLEHGTPAEGSIAAFESMVFFLSDNGFYRLDGGSRLTPIGAQKVDRYFFNDFDATYPYRVTATVDPLNKLYVVSYPGEGNDNGTPNKLLIYNWDVDRWSRAEVELERLHTAATQSGYTLDQLDTVSASLDALPFSLDSRVWTGAGRLLLAGFNTAHKIGFFNGDNLDATVDTTEAQLIPERRALVTGFRPMVQGGTVTAQLGTRNLQSESVTWGAEIAVNAFGMCNARSNARYHRARINATGDWEHIMGIDEIQASSAGLR